MKLICRRIFGLCPWKILAEAKSSSVYESKYAALQKCCIFVCCTAYFDPKSQIGSPKIRFGLKLCHFCAARCWYARGIDNLWLRRKSSGNRLIQRKFLEGQIETLFRKIHSIIIFAEFSQMYVGEWFWNMCWMDYDYYR